MRAWVFAGLAGVGCGSRNLEPPPTPLVASTPDRAAPLASRPIGAGRPADGIGTAHPIELVAAAEHGGWAVVCQARADSDRDGAITVTVGYHGDLGGDAMTPYLVRGGGAGTPIERVVAASRDDRWIAVIRDQALVVIDDRSATETAMPGADLRLDHQLGGPRTAAFDGTNRFAVFFRRAGEATRVVVRDLVQQRERELAVAGLPWRVEPVGDAPWMRLAVIEKDTDGNGRLDWPGVHTNAPVGAACSGPAASYSMYGGEGDQPVVYWLGLERGELRTEASVLDPADPIIARTAAGAVRVGDDIVIPETCAAEVGAISRDPLRLVATCASNDAEAPLELFGPGFHAVLDGTRVARKRTAPPQRTARKLLCVEPDSCYRLTDGHKLALGGSAMSATDSAVLVEARRDVLQIVDLQTERATPLLGARSGGGPEAGDIVALGDAIVDLARRKVLGAAHGRLHAVDTTGRALVSTAAGEHGFPIGPLVWQPASPLPASATVEPPPPPRVEGVVVDAQDRPVAGVTIAVSEPQPRAQPWTPPGAAAQGIAAFAAFSQYPLPSKTTTDGRFAWTPVLEPPYAILAIAPDGRTASVSSATGRAQVKLWLAPPAKLHITCAGFTSMTADLAGGIDLAFDHMRFGAACGETIGGLPEGTYEVAAKEDALKYASAVVTARGGVTTEVPLAVAPPGTIDGVVVEDRDDRPVAGIECQARWPHGDRDLGSDPGVASDAAGRFRLRISRGPRIEVVCREYGTSNARGSSYVDLRSGRATAKVRVVR